MSDYKLYPTDGDAQASPKRPCVICGASLSQYNKGNRCFHHIEILTGKNELLEVVPEEATHETRRAGENNENEAIPVSLITADSIVDTVCTYFGFDFEILKRHDRHSALAKARQVLMYLLYKDTSMSYPDIGDFLGGRDHTTVMHGSKKIATEAMWDDDLRAVIKLLRSQYL